MSRKVFCQFLKREAQGLDRPPHPGELGQRIFDNISREAWEEWLKRLAIIINENRLSTADPESILVIEQHMRGFLFDEGHMGGLPSGFIQPGSKK